MNQSKVRTPKAEYFILTLIIPMTPKPLLQSLAAAGSPQRGLGEQCGVARLSTKTPCQVRDEQFFNFLFFYSERKLFFFFLNWENIFLGPHPGKGAYFNWQGHLSPPMVPTGFFMNLPSKRHLNT